MNETKPAGNDRFKPLAFFAVFLALVGLRYANLLTDEGFVRFGTWAFGIYMLGEPAVAGFKGLGLAAADKAKASLTETINASRR